MKRIQAFEFEDLPWFPNMLRDFMTDYLGQAVQMLRLFDPAVDVIASALSAEGQHRIVDLGAGGGRIWLSLVPPMKARIAELQVRLTDAFPNQAAWSDVVTAMPDVVTADTRPVDAADVPHDLAGLRTLFLSFHHFPPPMAVAILRSAVYDRQPVAVFEGQRRDLRHLFQFAMSPIGVLLLTPGIRPFRLSRLVFTYLVPIIPLLVGWDGVVSVLRTYSVDEMRQLASRADPDSLFAWEIGELASGASVVPYMMGTPRSAP